MITKIVPAIEGQFHQKIVGVGFAGVHKRSLGNASLERRFKHQKIRVAFLVGNLFFRTIGKVYVIGLLGEMLFENSTILRSKLSHQQGRKQGKYLQSF